MLLALTILFSIIGIYLVVDFGLGKLEKKAISEHLSVKLERLKKVHYNEEQRCAVIRDLATDYFNSVDGPTREALSEMDKLLAKVRREIDNIEFELGSESVEMIEDAHARLEKFLRDKEEDLEQSLSNRMRKTTWEFKVNDFMKTAASGIHKASQDSKNSFQVKSRGKFRKPTDLCLQEIGALSKS